MCLLNLTDTPYQISDGYLVGSADPVDIQSSPEVKSKGNGINDKGSLEDHSSSSYRTCAATTIEAVGVPEPAEISQVQCVIDNLPDSLSIDQRLVAHQFIQDKSDIFSKSEFDLGRTDLLHHTINTGENRPFRLPLRRHPLAHLQIIDDHVNEMLEHDIIQPVTNSAWASNVVLVRKQDGSMRFCVDYRKLNLLTKKDSFHYQGLIRVWIPWEAVRIFQLWTCDKYIFNCQCQLRIWKNGLHHAEGDMVFQGDEFWFM